MTVVLFDQEHAGESDERPVVGVDPDDVRGAADLLVDPLERVGGAQLGPVLARKVIEREQLLVGLFEQPGDLRRRRLEPVDDVGEPLACFLAGVGVEDLADGGRDHRLLRAAAVAEHVAEEVHRAPLPPAPEDPGDRGLQALVGV